MDGGKILSRAGETELEHLRVENDELRRKYAKSIRYVRDKVNQLLSVMGTAPLRAEELDDLTLIDTDPIGIVSNSFSQILRHLHKTNYKLRFARDEIQVMFDSTGMGILVVDEAMRITAYNRKLAEMFFRGRGKMEGEPCQSAVCNIVSHRDGCVFSEIFKNGHSVSIERWILGERYFNIVGTPIKDANGRVTSVVMVYMDNTELKNAENSLRNSEERYRDLFENATDLIQSVGPDGSILYVNKAWRETLGYGEEEINRLSIFDIIHPDCKRCGPDFKSVVYGEKSGRVETVFMTKDGTEIIVEGNINSMIEGGRFTGTRGIFRDITLRKKIEAKVERSLREKEVLLSEVHHRVKNNMAIISALLKMQSAYVADPEGRQMLLECRSRIKSMALVHEKLYQTSDFSNIALQDYVQSLTQSIMDMFTVKKNLTIKAFAQGITLNIDTLIPCGLIINELVTNALKYAFEGDGPFEIEVMFMEAEGGMIVLSVSDNGKGLPEGLDLSDTRGLGFQLIRALSSQLNAKVTIERETGATFRFQFPKSRNSGVG